MAYVFDNKVDPTLEILKYVAPLKQREVKILIDTVPACVEMLVLFGSAITDCCRPFSDIDLVIVGEELDSHQQELLAYRKQIKSEMDILMMSRRELQEAVKTELPFYKELYEKGIVIYEKP